MTYRYYVHVLTDQPGDPITDQKINDDLNLYGGLGWRLVSIERQTWDGVRRVTVYFEMCIDNE